MVGLPVDCPNCGIYEDTIAIDLGGDNTFTSLNNRTRCFRCGAMARYIDGTYTTVSGVVKSFTNSNLTRDEVEKVADTLRKLNDGYLSDTEATRLLNDISPWLSELISLIKGNKELLGFVVTILLPITLFVLQSHADAESDEKAQRTAQTSIEVQEKTLSVQQKILDEVLRHPEAKNFKAMKLPKKSATARKSRVKPASGAGNRHERRKAAKIGRSKRSK